MGTDLIFMAGFVIGILAIPAGASALLDGRSPRASAYMLVTAAILVAIAMHQRPNTYGFNTVVPTISRVLDRYVY